MVGWYQVVLEDVKVSKNNNMQGVYTSTVCIYNFIFPSVSLSSSVPLAFANSATD